MRLNANLLRIAHSFLRDADDVVTVLRDGALEGAVLAACNGHTMLVMRDPTAEVAHSGRVRLDKASLRLINPTATSIDIDHDGFFVLSEPNIQGPCYVDSEYQLLDHGRMLRPVLESAAQSTAVRISASMLVLLAKTAEELAVHTGFKKVEAELVITSGGDRDPILVRFGTPNAVAVGMPRSSDKMPQSIEEIAAWAL